MKLFRKSVLGALVMLMTISSPGCMRYVEWRNEMATAAAEKQYSKSVSAAASSNALSGTWIFDESLPPVESKKIALSRKPLQYTLSLFQDGRFSMTLENPNSWTGRCIREYHGSWQKTAPGIVQLTFEDSEGPGGGGKTRDVDLNKAMNSFVKNDQMLKE